MSSLDTSIKKIDGIIKRKLSTLSDKCSPAELIELHAFLKEARELRQTVQAIEEPERILEDEDTEFAFMPEGEEYEEDGDFVAFFIEGCNLIKSLYALLDDHKIKETDCEWIFEETRDYIDRARESVGARVPELPIMRVVSKKRETEKSKPKTSKK